MRHPPKRERNPVAACRLARGFVADALQIDPLGAGPPVVRRTRRGFPMLIHDARVVVSFDVARVNVDMRLGHRSALHRALRPALLKFLLCARELVRTFQRGAAGRILAGGGWAIELCPCRVATHLLCDGLFGGRNPEPIDAVSFGIKRRFLRALLFCNCRGVGRGDGGRGQPLLVGLRARGAHRGSKLSNDGFSLTRFKPVGDQFDAESAKQYSERDRSYPECKRRLFAISVGGFAKDGSLIEGLLLAET